MEELQQRIRELEKAGEALKRERQSLYSLLDAVPGFVFLRAPDYSVRFANRYFREHFGEPVEKPCHEIMANRKEPCDVCRTLNIFESKRPQQWEWTSKIDNRLYQIYDYPFIDLDGQLLVLEFGIEITELKKDKEQLRSEKNQLEEFNTILEQQVREEEAGNREKEPLVLQQSRQAAMGEMIGNIAHQWRQPLNVISLLIQDLNECYTYGNFTREYLENAVNKITDVIQYMSRTIDDFSNFLKPETERSLFSLRESIERTISFLEPRLKYHKIDFEIDIPDNLAIIGYPNEYVQVLLNIISNANDVFHKRKTPRPKIVIKGFREAGKCVVTITDNGGGISEHIMDRIFEPYVTTKEKKSSMGIGLYMSKTIIEKNMQGKLSARNIANGAEFRIEI